MASNATPRWLDNSSDGGGDGSDHDDGDLDAPFRIVRERMGDARRGSQPRELRLPWERRLSLRGKLWRGGLATLTVALLAFLMLGGP
ncbi:MAG TPA: hypothetical protein VID72_11950, partial [Ktedonobacterales bacterium]